MTAADIGRQWSGGLRAGVSTSWGLAYRQLAVIMLLSGAVALLASIHLAAVARPLFVAGALAIAAFAIRRSPWHYLTATLWFWTISPFVRRVIDYYGGFQATNIVLLTPNLLALLMIGPLLTSPYLLKQREAATGALLLVPVLYGLAISLFHGDIVPGLIATTDWLIPLFYYFYFIHLIPRIDEAEPHFRAFVALNIAVIGIYGVYQCFAPPAWDTEWVRNVKMFSMRGSALFTLKPFSTLNSPGTCASWVAGLILLSLHFRNRLSLIALPIALFFLTLTQVRANLGEVAVGLLAALVSGHRQMVRSLLLVLAVMAVVVVVLAAIDPKVADILSARFGTVANLSGDESAQARAGLYERFPDLLAKYPFGVGIGAIGRGAVAANGAGSQDDFSSIDSGLVATYLALGWLGGTIYFAGMVAFVAQALTAAFRSRSPAAMALAITALSCAVTSAFTNLVGLQGVIIWLSAGYASAIGVHARSVTAAANAARRSGSRYPTPTGHAAAAGHLQ